MNKNNKLNNNTLIKLKNKKLKKNQKNNFCYSYDFKIIFLFL